MTTKIREWLEQQAEERDQLLTTLDGRDDAIVGIADRCSQPAIVIYDYARLVVSLMGDGMTQEEAEEWVDTNILGAWVGDRTPLVLTTRPDES